MADREAEFSRRLGRRIAERARRRAQQAILNLASDSRRGQALRRSMQITEGQQDDERSVFFIEVPFYWAVYYHDGRGPITARPGKYLAFFKNPDKDPRIPGRNYPVRSAEVRTLREAISKSEFRRLVDSGELILAKRVGPAKAHPFFGRGMAVVARDAGRIAQAEMSAFVRECLGDDLNPPLEEARITIR